MDNQTRTAVEAIRAGDAASLRQILQENPSLAKKTISAGLIDEGTLLHVAAESSMREKAVFQVLVEAGVPTTRTDGRGWSAISFLLESEEARKVGHRDEAAEEVSPITGDLIDLILDQAQSVEPRNFYELELTRTMTTCAFYSMSGTAQKYLERGGDPFQEVFVFNRPVRAATALMLMPAADITPSAVSFFRRVFEKNPDRIEAPLDLERVLPLTFAVDQRRPQAVRELLNLGANPLARNADPLLGETKGKTAYSVLLKHDQRRDPSTLSDEEKVIWDLLESKRQEMDMLAEEPGLIALPGRETRQDLSP